MQIFNLCFQWTARQTDRQTHRVTDRQTFTSQKTARQSINRSTSTSFIPKNPCLIWIDCMRYGWRWSSCCEAELFFDLLIDTSITHHFQSYYFTVIGVWCPRYCFVTVIPCSLPLNLHICYTRQWVVDMVQWKRAYDGDWWKRSAIANTCYKG